MAKLRNILCLILLFQLSVSCEEEQLVTEGELLGTWNFLRFDFDGVEYLSTDPGICGQISEKLGSIWFINTDISCTMGVTSLSGKSMVQWEFIDNCNLRWNRPSRIHIDGNNLEVASYTFKVLSYNSNSLKLEVIRSSAWEGFPNIPVGGKYTFVRQ
jgi:hypothetical protein